MERSESLEWIIFLTLRSPPLSLPPPLSLSLSLSLSPPSLSPSLPQVVP